MKYHHLTALAELKDYIETFLCERFEISQDISKITTARMIDEAEIDLEVICNG